MPSTQTKTTNNYKDSKKRYHKDEDSKHNLKKQKNELGCSLKRSKRYYSNLCDLCDLSQE